jgi:hypothetical protein
MKKIFMKVLMAAVLLSGTQLLNAQYKVVWPTTDTNTVRMSQFADSASIFALYPGKTPPAGFKGWLTKGLQSANPAKKDSAIWTWTGTGQANVGSAYSQFGAALNTRIQSNTSRGTGAAIFNSDYLDGRGTSGKTWLDTPGTGQAPSDGNGHNGELWSPVMDARGFTNMSVVFNQVYRHHSSSPTIPCFASSAISWSNDNGKTWNDTICIRENEVLGLYQQTVVQGATSSIAPSNSQRVAIRLPNSVGTDSFRVKFIFDGDYFFWMVDDVELAQINNNLTIDPTYFSKPPAYATPRSQTDSVVFAANVINTGANKATNVKLTAFVRNDSSQQEVFTTTVNLGTLNPGQMSGATIIPTKWAFPKTGVGSKFFFSGYRVTSDSTDQFTNNDSVRTLFSLRDSLFRTDFFTDGKAFLPGYRPVSTAWTANEPHSWKIGGVFYTSTVGTAVTLNNNIASLSSFVGRTFGAVLYKWVDANTDGLVQETERTPVAYAERTVAAGNVNPFAMYWQNANGNGPVFLQANSVYLAMFEFTSNGSTDDLFYIFNDGQWMNANMDAYKKAGRPRYYGVINSNANTAAAVWRTNVFAGTKYIQTNLNSDPARDTVSANNNIPNIQMTIWPGRVDNKEVLSDNNKMAIFPNPASDRIHVDLNLEQQESVILLRIIDVNGRIIMEKEYNNVKQGQFELNMSTLANGTYSLQLQTIDAYKTMRFVIAK